MRWSEALDIKTLTTLIMATPKTDIEQSVGRILREKHSSPLVVDIIDAHDVFKNQWNKRKAFYKKEQYKILYTTSNKYSTNYATWKTVYDPLIKKQEADMDMDMDIEDVEGKKTDAVCWLK